MQVPHEGGLADGHGLTNIPKDCVFYCKRVKVRIKEATFIRYELGAQQAPDGVGVVSDLGPSAGDAAFEGGQNVDLLTWAPRAVASAVR